MFVLQVWTFACLTGNVPLIFHYFHLYISMQDTGQFNKHQHLKPAPPALKASNTSTRNQQPLPSLIALSRHPSEPWGQFLSVLHTPSFAHTFPWLHLPLLLARSFPCPHLPLLTFSIAHTFPYPPWLLIPLLIQLLMPLLIP